MRVAYHTKMRGAKVSHGVSLPAKKLPIRSSRGRDDLHAQLGSLAFESLEHLFLVLALIIICTVIDILTFILEHMIDNPGDLARGGDNRFGRAVLGPHAAKEGPQGGLAPADRLGRQAERARSAARSNSPRRDYAGRGRLCRV